MKTRWLINLATIAVFGVLVWVLRPSERALPEVTFTLTDGRALSSSELRGKPLLVNFWSVSCDICLRDMPRLTHLQETLRESGLVVIGVAADYDPPPAVMGVVASKQPGYPIALDVHGELSKAFGGITATPTTFLIDRDGNIRHTEVGPLDENRVSATLLTL